MCKMSEMQCEINYDTGQSILKISASGNASVEGYKELVEQMSCLAANPAKRRECRARSLEQAKKFTWRKAAEIVLDVYERTLKSPSYFPGE